MQFIELMCYMLISTFVFVFFMQLISRKTEPDRSTDTEEDTRMIQEMHHGFMRMEERIDALETILMERDKVNM